MALLAPADLTAICDRAITAGLAQPPRDALFFGLASGVVANVVSTAANQADALRIEVNNLNQLVEPTERDGYLLAIWLTNAAARLKPIRPSDAAFFEDWAAKVAATPAPAPLTSATAAGLVSVAQTEALTNAAVMRAAGHLRDEMPNLHQRATKLMVAKRLHDALHNIQLGIIPLWSRLVAAMATSPALVRPMAADRQRELQDKGLALAGEFGFLEVGEPLRNLAQKTADDLVAAARVADAALAAEDTEDLKAAITKVRGIVTEGMQTYATRMEMYREALDLSDVLADLSRLAGVSADAAVKDNAGRLASALAAIMQDLNVLGPQHSQWQLLDVRLGALEKWFGFLHLGPTVYSTFDVEWDAINAAIETLMGGSANDRFARVAAVRDHFLAASPVPIQSAPSEPAGNTFADFVIEVRRVFLEVDLRMKQICNQLREITNQLGQL